MKIALAGNPNCGKTTLFNVLTGSTAHVGNWAGVTVEHTSGFYKIDGQEVELIDLPGIYSLSPYTPEEVVSRRYIVEEQPDLILNVVDASNLERNLYLTTQLLEMDCPVVLALNMIDVAEKQGVQIDTAHLQLVLGGVPVIPVSAVKKTGIETLMRTAIAQAGTPRQGLCVFPDRHIRQMTETIRQMLQEKGETHALFHAVKLLEGDMIETRSFPGLSDTVAGFRRDLPLKPELKGDVEAAVADLRYQFITDSCMQGVRKPPADDRLTTTEKIDRIVMHKWLGIPIFLCIMFLIFHVTFSRNFLFLEQFLGEGIASPGIFLQGLMEQAVNGLSKAVTLGITSLGASDWVLGLVVDGILGGVGAVLSFLPQIMLLFLFLSIMEDTGYMARGAFLMDRLLRRFGLSGKAFMPLLMGFGCSVPAMMGTRTLESEKERRMTIMLLPFFSCGAKMPIWATFAAAVFPDYGDIAVFAMYLIGIVVAILMAMLLKHTVLKAEPSPFAMEMPQYHLPQAKSLSLHLWDKVRDFISRAATIIAGATMVIWVLSNFSFQFQMVEPSSAGSMLGVIGEAIRPVFAPLGFAGGSYGWCAVVAILTGLIAKEMVVSSLGVLYAGAVGAAGFSVMLASVFSPLSALSFMVFNLLTLPCMAAVATARAELKSWKWFLFTLCFWFGTAWTVSFLIYQIGSRLGF